MFGKKRFEVVETQSLFTFSMWVILDHETGIKYLATGSPSPRALTPLLDEKGDVVLARK